MRYGVEIMDGACKSNRELLTEELKNLGFKILSENEKTGEVVAKCDKSTESGQIIRTDRGECDPKKYGYKILSRRWKTVFFPSDGKYDPQNLTEELETKLIGYSITMDLVEKIKLSDTEIRGLKLIVSILKESADEQAKRKDVSKELYVSIRNYERRIMQLEAEREINRATLEQNIPLLNGKSSQRGYESTFATGLASRKEEILKAILEGKEDITIQDLF